MTFSQKTQKYVVTIDGPAGSGKSTVSKNLAKQINFDYLDTGAMYRAVALLGVRNRVDWNDPTGLVRLAESHHIENIRGITTLDGEDISAAIRTIEVTGLTHFAADNPAIRDIMVRLQRQAAENRNLVTEGRDQGSVVFPDAFCKFYLTASAEERARRRQKELAQKGENASFDDLLQQMILRDLRDSQRQVGPLCVPENAVIIETDSLTIDEVIAKMAGVVLARIEKK